jgi:hypothetical protein
MRDRVREPVNEREPRVHLDGEAPVRRGDEHAPPDPDRLRHEPTLAHGAADVLDHGVREDDVELTVRERERTGVALDVPDPRVANPEALALVEAERGDPVRPRVELLEEVERPATAPLAEAELVRADVEDRGLRGRAELVEEQLQLPPPGPERDRVDEPHAWKYRVRGGQ